MYVGISESVPYEFRGYNNWFFMNRRVSLTASMEFNYLLYGIKVERTNVNIYRISKMQSGYIYKMHIIQPNFDIEYLNDARLNIYFYVTSNEIYRIWPYVLLDDELIMFYNDDELLLSTLNTETKIIESSELVFSVEDVFSELKGGEEGRHFSIVKEGNVVRYRRFDISPNGQTFFYERFTWEYGRGLIEYASGFRAGRDILYLNDFLVINPEYLDCYLDLKVDTIIYHSTQNTQKGTKIPEY